MVTRVISHATSEEAHDAMIGAQLSRYRIPGRLPGTS